MIVDVNWGDAAVSVLEAAVGAGLGFLLGIRALKMQQKVEKAERAEQHFDECVDSIARLQRTAVLNIETLYSLQKQLMADLTKENNAITTLLEELEGATDDTFGEKYTNVERKLKLVRHFFQRLPSPALMEFPAFSEFSDASELMPYLTMFVHRSSEQYAETKSIIAERNRLIEEYARENVSQMHYSRRLYFAQMLSGSVTALDATMNFGLLFSLLVKRQTDSFLRHHITKRKVVLYDIPHELEQLLIKTNSVPGMTDKVTDFSKLPPHKTA